MDKVLHQRYSELIPSIIDAQRMDLSAGPNQTSSTQVNKMIEAEVEKRLQAELKKRAAAQDEDSRSVTRRLFDDEDREDEAQQMKIKTREGSVIKNVWKR